MKTIGFTKEELYLLMRVINNMAFNLSDNDEEKKLAMKLANKIDKANHNHG